MTKPKNVRRTADTSAKSAKKIGGLLAATLLVCSTPSAFSGVATEATASKNVVQPKAEHNLLCFFDDLICFDVEERARFEWRENNFDFNNSVDALTDDAWLLQRFRIGVAVKPTDWLKIYAQGQDSREYHSDRPDFPGVMAAEGDDSFDLRQGYITLGNPKHVSLTIGRQILSYGDERLVGSFDWNNLGRVFDAAKLRIEQPTWWLDVFSSSVVVMTRGESNKSDLFNGNEAHRDLVFSGIYFSSTACPASTLDLYLFSLNQDNGNDANQEGILGLPRAGAAPAQGGDLTLRSDFFTLGTRLKGDPKKMGGFEYDAEVAGQLGKVAGLDLEAFAAHVGVGYNFFDFWAKPRIYAEYNFATGDSDPTDDKNNTFQNLFPTNHKFYGYMDLFSWQNLHNPAISLRLTPLPKVTFQVDGHAFFAATNEDAWYRANGLTRVRPLTPAARNADKYEGSEFDATLIYKPTKNLAFQAGYSHFWAGDYLKATGASDDADFGYVMATVSF